MKVRKVKSINPRTQQEGLTARVLTNGRAEFDDICELAGLNTTMNVAELEAAAKLVLQAAARELKNGKIISLGPLGEVVPSVTSKWVEKAEDLQKSDLALKVNYRPSDDIAAAVKSAKLVWANAEDEKKEQEAGDANTVTDPDDETGDDTDTTVPGGTPSGNDPDAPQEG